MSGWIKFDKDMADDPRLIESAMRIIQSGYVVARASHSGRGGTDLVGAELRAFSANAVIGALVTLWKYADEHIRDDDSLELGASALDALVGLEGFTEHISRDWVQERKDGCVVLPGYCEKNGLISKRKKREQGAARQRRFKQRHRVVTSASQTSGNGVSSALPQAVDQDQYQDLKNNTPKPPRASRSAPVDEDFVKFWAAYPRKAAKQDALKAWAKARASFSNGDLRHLFDGLERAKASEQWRKDGGAFVPHPATWLNGRRWEDEAQPPAAQSSFLGVV